MASQFTRQSWMHCRTVHGENQAFFAFANCTGADLTDYFNYGFDEHTWRAYCQRQKQMRDERARPRMGVMGMPGFMMGMEKPPEDMQYFMRNMRMWPSTKQPSPPLNVPTGPRAGPDKESRRHEEKRRKTDDDRYRKRY